MKAAMRGFVKKVLPPGRARVHSALLSSEDVNVWNAMSRMNVGFVASMPQVPRLMQGGSTVNTPAWVADWPPPMNSMYVAKASPRVNTNVSKIAGASSANHKARWIAYSPPSTSGVRRKNGSSDEVILNRQNMRLSVPKGKFTVVGNVIHIHAFNRHTLNDIHRAYAETEIIGRKHWIITYFKDRESLVYLLKNLPLMRRAKFPLPLSMSIIAPEVYKHRANADQRIQKMQKYFNFAMKNFTKNVENAKVRDPTRKYNVFNVIVKQHAVNRPPIAPGIIRI